MTAKFDEITRRVKKKKRAILYLSIYYTRVYKKNLRLKNNTKKTMKIWWKIYMYNKLELLETVRYYVAKNISVCVVVVVVVVFVIVGRSRFGSSVGTKNYFHAAIRTEMTWQMTMKWQGTPSRHGSVTQWQRTPSRHGWRGPRRRLTQPTAPFCHLRFYNVRLWENSSDIFNANKKSKLKNRNWHLE
jgi:hypothetical protein